MFLFVCGNIYFGRECIVHDGALHENNKADINEREIEKRVAQANVLVTAREELVFSKDSEA